MVHARIDLELKTQVEQIFQALGLTSANALRLFYQQVILHRGLPFDVKIPNAETQEAILEARKGNLSAFDIKTLQE